MENAKANGKQIKVALVRGNYLNEWENKYWDDLDGFKTIGFCSKKNLLSLQNFKMDIKKLYASSDNFIIKNFLKYGFGCYKKMYGLEKKLVDFDIAHTAELYNYYTTQAVNAKKLNPKLKVVVHFADNTFGRFEYNYWPGFKIPPAYWRNKINKIIQNNIKGADFFIPITKYSEQLLLEYGAPPEKIEILTYGIDLPSAGTTVHMPASVADLVRGDLYLMVNRITKEKGVYEALYGWKLFMLASPNIKRTLLIIGDGPERPNLVRIADELKLTDSIKFIQNLPNEDVKKIFQKAKCLILDSLPNSVWQEQFGFVLAEAIAGGCPVVSTFSGAIPEVIEGAGLLIPPGHPVELRDALLKMDDLAVYKALKDNCEKLKNKFSVVRFKQQLISIYQNLVSQ